VSETSKRQFALAGLLARDPIAAQLHQTHLLVLEQVCGNERPITPGEIMERVEISHSQLSRLLTTLEDHGLILRSDTKPSFVMATRLGKAMIKRVNAYVASCLADRTAA
jgi:DNA-binding MarR family transcriptional regulator